MRQLPLPFAHPPKAYVAPGTTSIIDMSISSPPFGQATCSECFPECASDDSRMSTGPLGFQFHRSGSRGSADSKVMPCLVCDLTRLARMAANLETPVRQEIHFRGAGRRCQGEPHGPRASATQRPLADFSDRHCRCSPIRRFREERYWRISILRTCRTGATALAGESRSIRHCLTSAAASRSIASCSSGA